MDGFYHELTCGGSLENCLQRTPRYGALNVLRCGLKHYCFWWVKLNAVPKPMIWAGDQRCLVWWWSCKGSEVVHGESGVMEVCR